MDIPTMRAELAQTFPAMDWHTAPSAETCVGVSRTIHGLTILVSVAVDGHGFTAEAVYVRRVRQGWGPTLELAVIAAATRCLVLPFLRPPPRTSPPAARIPLAPDPRRDSGGAASGSGASPSTECPCDGTGPCRSCGGTGFVRPS